MKESTLLEMKNKVESLTRVIQHLINENNHLRTLSVGNLETLKLIPGYDQAIETLKERSKKEKKENAPNESKEV